MPFLFRGVWFSPKLSYHRNLKTGKTYHKRGKGEKWERRTRGKGGKHFYKDHNKVKCWLNLCSAIPRNVTTTACLDFDVCAIAIKHFLCPTPFFLVDGLLKIIFLPPTSHLPLMLAPWMIIFLPPNSHLPLMLAPWGRTSYLFLWSIRWCTINHLCWKRWKSYPINLMD